MEQLQLFGLSESSWAPPPVEAGRSPLQRCGDRDYHAKLLSYFVPRLTASENRMRNLYPRWRVNEMKLQAWVDLPEYERILEQMNKDKAPPSPVSITFPYAYANAWTVTTYHLHTFCGRRPMFQVAAAKPNSVGSAHNMEKVLQWNADATRMVKTLFNFFMDPQIYGVGALRCLWKRKTGKRSVWVKNPNQLQAMLARAQGHSGMVRQVAEKLLFEGNEVEPIDPFMFFPDPNVPMADVNKKGEYVFWRSFIGKHELLQGQANGSLAWVDRCQPTRPGSRSDGNESTRSSWLGGDSPAAYDSRQGGAPYYQFDQGSVLIIPKELGFSDSMVPERWLVGIVNKTQIVQLEPLDVEFDMHPVAVTEPNTFGYGFAQPSLVDFVGPIQDTLSWLLNSHIHNVRAALNNSFVYDPSMIEQQDLKNPAPGKMIRLKRSAMGQDVRMALQQLQVADVTGSHMNDLGAFQRVADMISGVGDNIRGLQDAGGRKTATEVRTSAEAGASRLAAQARLISAQGMTDLTEMMATNLQAKLSEEVYVSIVGPSGMDQPISISPGAIMGDFHYPIHDGTLPLDRVALLDIWREIMMGVGQDQELRSTYSMPKLFEYVAKLGGAENIDSFKVAVGDPPPGSVPMSELPQ